MTERSFSPGFRLSALDVAVLVIGGVSAGAVSFFVPWLGAAVALVVSHFFLFCNVLRMSRLLELIWAAVFSILAGSEIAFDRPGWPVVFGVSILLTAVLAVVEARRPSYHGVGWTRLNPGLPAWWAARNP